MPTWEATPRFWLRWKRLTPAQQFAFQRARRLFVEGLESGWLDPRLRVKRFHSSPGVFELSWAPDGRRCSATVRNGSRAILTSCGSRSGRTTSSEVSIRKLRSGMAAGGVTVGRDCNNNGSVALSVVTIRHQTWRQCPRRLRPLSELSGAALRRLPDRADDCAAPDFDHFDRPHWR
jgi:hypothetical protein